MNLVGPFREGLFATPFRGRMALMVAVISIGLPTLLGVALEGIVTQRGFVPYFPFMVFAAVLLDWKSSTIVMLICAVLADWFFVGPHYRLLEDPSDLFGTVLFLTGSTLLIAIMHAMRTAFQDLIGPTVEGGVIFSLKEGQAWASWPRAGFHLRLGPEDAVAGMMSDFLAQIELAKRLAIAARSGATDEGLQRVESSHYDPSRT